MTETTDPSDFAALWSGCGWLFRAVTENVDDCVSVFDRAGSCRAANSALGRWLNRAPAELLGRTVFDLWPAAVAQRDDAEQNSVLRGEIIDREEECPRGGQPRRVRLRKAPLGDNDGVVHGVLSVFADLGIEREPEAMELAVPIVITPLANRKTILLVDPDVNLLRMIGRILEPCGIDVKATRDGRQGLQVYRHDPDAIAAVILEQNLPAVGPSGLETMNALLCLNSRLPIVLTSNSAQPPPSWWVNVPGLRFLSKPFMPEQLIQAVRQVLAPPPTGNGNGSMG